VCRIPRILFVEDDYATQIAWIIRIEALLQPRKQTYELPCENVRRHPRQFG